MMKRIISAELLHPVEQRAEMLVDLTS